MKKTNLLAITLLFVMISSFAVAKDIKNITNNLDVMTVNYGVNNLQIANKEIAITRAMLPSEVAGQGDVYTVMSEQKNGLWELVQYQDRKFTTSTWSHTNEDSVSTVRFFASKDKKELYLLKAERAYESSVPSSGVAIFNLYKLERNKNFNFFEFKNIGIFKTKTKYCNIELALNKELNVDLPSNYQACNK